MSQDDACHMLHSKRALVLQDPDEPLPKRRQLDEDVGLDDEVLDGILTVTIGSRVFKVARSDLRLWDYRFLDANRDDHVEIHYMADAMDTWHALLTKGPETVVTEPHEFLLILRYLCHFEPDANEFLQRIVSEDAMSSATGPYVWSCVRAYDVMAVTFPTDSVLHMSNPLQVLRSAPGNLSDNGHKLVFYIENSCSNKCDVIAQYNGAPLLQDDNLCVAGGFAWKADNGQVDVPGVPRSDIDYFVFGQASDRKAAVERFARMMAQQFPGCYFVHYSSVITVVPQGDHPYVQLIYTNKESIHDVLTAFDLECCRVAIWRNNVVATKAYQVSKQRQVVISDRPSKPYRLYKWSKRTGFAFPNYEIPETFQDPKANREYRVPDGDFNPAQTKMILEMMLRGKVTQSVDELLQEFSYRAFNTSTSYDDTPVETLVDCNNFTLTTSCRSHVRKIEFTQPFVIEASANINLIFEGPCAERCGGERVQVGVNWSPDTLRVMHQMEVSLMSSLPIVRKNCSTELGYITVKVDDISTWKPRSGDVVKFHIKPTYLVGDRELKVTWYADRILSITRSSYKVVVPTG